MIDKGELQRKLAKGILIFQDNYLSFNASSPVGLLCQVWLPERDAAGRLELKTKGMPFCVAGMGDLLALFRCISCRFNFGGDASFPKEKLGAPGRVFLSGQPELACNVQQYPREAYLRRAEAEQCSVQSSMLLPVFTTAPSSENRPPTLGIIEIVQTSDDMAFLPVARLLGAVLLKCGLHTSTLVEVTARMPTRVTSIELPLCTGLLDPTGSNGTTADVGSDGDVDVDDVVGASVGGIVDKDDDGDDANGASGDTSLQHTGDDDCGGGGGGNDDDDDEDFDEEEEERGRGGGRRSYDESRGSPKGRGGGGGNRASSNRRGKAGKPGVNLTLADLQGQFGVGLKEAATTLGVCATTLKRACRRHGIQRWPRRALQKVSRTLDEMERRGAMRSGVAGTVPMGALLHPSTGQLLLPQPSMELQMQPMAVDSRWAALANMLPNVHHQSAGGGAFIMPTGSNWVGPGGWPALTGGGGGDVNGTAAEHPPPPPLQQVVQQQQQAASDFSLEGAVTMSNKANAWNNNKNNNNNAESLTVATGLTQWGQGPPSAANAALAAAMAAIAAGGGGGGDGGLQQQQQGNGGNNNVVPSFLRPDHQRHHHLNQQQQQQHNHHRKHHLESPFASDGQSPGDPNAPVLLLPLPSSAFSLPNLSQMSVPSLGPSFVMPPLYMPPSTIHTTIHGGNTPNVDGTSNRGGTSPGGPHQQHPRDDVGLLDSTILELMLSADSRRLVGATDDDLRKLFKKD